MEEEKESTAQLIAEAKEIIKEFSKEEPVINFSQSSKEIDEVININIEKGESEDMAVEKELEEVKVAETEVVETPEVFEAEGSEEKIEESKEAEKVEEAAEEQEEKIEEACKMEEAEEDEKDDEEEDKEEKIEEAAEEMSKADRKTFEARIATLENNLKIVKAELEVAAPFKALYEDAMAKIADLEAYKEDVELDKLKADKEKYASTCNFSALEEEDKAVVQEKIDDYKFSLYDFKAFMADVLKKYSRKQAYSNMEKIISYFSVEDTNKADDVVEMPSDKNQADRILDKYSDIKL